MVQRAIFFANSIMELSSIIENPNGDTQKGLRGAPERSK